MAKVAVKEKKTKKSAEPVKMVTIQDLEAETGIPGAKIRYTLRRHGFRAPKVESEGFGPRAKYAWPEGSEELARVREILASEFEVVEEDEEEKPSKTAKKSAVKKPAGRPEPEDEVDEEEDFEDEDDEDEDDE